jgi:hypothetical protein
MSNGEPGWFQMLMGRRWSKEAEFFSAPYPADKGSAALVEMTRRRDSWKAKAQALVARVGELEVAERRLADVIAALDEGGAPTGDGMGRFTACGRVRELLAAWGEFRCANTALDLMDAPKLTTEPAPMPLVERIHWALARRSE